MLPRPVQEAFHETYFHPFPARDLCGGRRHRPGRPAGCRPDWLRRQAQRHQNQLKIARDHGNSDQVAGLGKRCAVDNCTDASLRKEREQKVLDARHEVAQPEEGREKGDAEKINKRKDKLAESRKELQEAVDDLDR